MTRFYSDDKYIYNVDMMYTYLKIFKHEIISININNFDYILTNKRWYNTKTKINYSINDVINDPLIDTDKYEKIVISEFKYPIIINNINVVDGLHRVAKAKLINRKHISAYIFNDKLMKKFIIFRNREGAFDKINKIEPYQYMEKFFKRFRNKHDKT